MSVYQYYHFERHDGVLSAKQKNALRILSSRAEISSTHFMVHYDYGDLKAEPSELMAQYFDVGIYYADWGQVICYLKVPLNTVPQPFMEVDDGEFTLCEDGENYQLFTFILNEDDRDLEDDDAEDYLQHLSSLRLELLNGDYRLLYLPWLKRAFEGDNTLSKLPLIDFDFKHLSEAQLAFAELFYIPLEACRALNMLLASSQAHVAETKHLTAAEEIERLSASDKDRLLRELFEQGQLSATQARALVGKPIANRDYQYWLSTSSLEDYWQAANDEIVRERLIVEEQQREKMRRETLERLNKIFSSREAHWKNVQKYSEQGHASAYDKAAKEVQDLYDAYLANNALVEFIPIYQRFAKQIERRKTLVRRLQSLHQQIFAD
ncbi:hypothetical protein [Xenorhabdus doucetiae]|nr:hypothetical protein [Xenorhabdus doucetiae]CDG19619.1 conserved protein of unknown function [Xenorhabdus doucetiae]